MLRTARRYSVSNNRFIAGTKLPLAWGVILMLALLVCAPGCSMAGEPVGLRINTTHGIGNARGAVMDAGLSLISQVLVSASSDRDGSPYLPPDALLKDGLAHGATLLSSSFSGWHSLYDFTEYRKLTEKGVAHVYAYAPHRPQPLQAPPPAAFVTVNRVGGATGGGIEFGVTTDYMGGRGKADTSSGVTAQLAGLMACLKYRHPGWNWFDVKAALRTTASNFSGGYDPMRYGYGVIDYQAADALGAAGSLPLFGPAVAVRVLPENRLRFLVNAFRQKRRFSDVLFRFSSRPVTTLKEMSLYDIIALGGDFVCSSYLNRDPFTYVYRLVPGETVWFVWFTQDVYGRYSRIEPYAVLGPFTGTLNGKLQGA